MIGALILRELITRYGRKNLGFLWFFFEPMLFTLAISLLWSVVRLHTLPGLSIVAFAVTGYSSVLLWRNAASRCCRAAHVNWALLYHRTVTPLDIYLARALLEAAAASISLVVLSLLFIGTGLMSPPADLGQVIFGWVLLILFGVSFGTLVGAASDLSEVVERFWHVLAYILFPVSGAVTMANWIPEPLRSLVLLLPMVHGVELLRGGWFGELTPTHGSATYLLVSTIVIGTLALILVRAGGRRVTSE
jgi:capsular polysaccharide transport system permease protein